MHVENETAADHMQISKSRLDCPPNPKKNR